MNYKKIFILEDSSIERGGKEVITSLGRKKDDDVNLAVLRLSDLFTIQENIKDGTSRFASAEKECLDYVNSLNIYPDRSTSNRVMLGKPTVLNENLHFKVIDDITSDGPEDEKRIVSRLKNKYSGSKVVFITSDDARITQHSLRGNLSERPRCLVVDERIVDEGLIEGSDDLFSKLYASENKSIPVEEAQQILQRDLYPNQFVRIEGSHSSGIAQVVGKRIMQGDQILKLENVVLQILDDSELSKSKKDNVLGVKPLDYEQVLALRELLLNDEISMCAITGKQGSGKTLLTYAAMAHQIMDFTQKTPFHALCSKSRALYKKIVLYKPISLVGGKKNDVGFLPGSLFQKIKPYLQGYIDCHNDNTSLGKELSFEDMFRHPHITDSDFPKPRKFIGSIDGGKLPANNPAIELRYIGHARGNTLTNTIISVDEAQNFTPFEMKTIVERAGPGSKIIITGDPVQVDNPSVTSVDINGLTSAIRHYLGKPYFGLINLDSNYRHQMSKDTEGWNAPS